jgi:hypothetical protein
MLFVFLANYRDGCWLQVANMERATTATNNFCGLITIFKRPCLNTAATAGSTMPQEQDDNEQPLGECFENAHWPASN